MVIFNSFLAMLVITRGYIILGCASEFTRGTPQVQVENINRLGT